MNNNKEFSIDFIGVGVVKSGTTWIYRILKDHPEVFIDKKEINFFNSETFFGEDLTFPSNYEQGLDWYKRFFDEAQDENVKGEYSVNYFHDDLAPERIKEHFPNVKIIISLRNPVDMIQSLYYWFQKSSAMDYGEGSFEEALDSKAKDLIELGFYSDRVERYLDLFGPSQIFFTPLHEIKNKPEVVSKQLYEFLGVDPSFKSLFLKKKINPAVEIRYRFIAKIAGWFSRLIFKTKSKKLFKLTLGNPILIRIYQFINYKPKKYPKLSKEARENLLEIYKKDIRKLEKLISKDLSYWLD